MLCVSTRSSTFPFSRLFGPTVQRRTQTPLVTGERALRLPALTVLPLREMALHLPPIFGLGMFTALAPPVDGDDRAANAQIFAAEAMIFFAIEGCVCQDAIPAHDQGGLVQGWANCGLSLLGPALTVAAVKK